MSTIDIIVRTLKKEDFPLSVSGGATLTEFKELASAQLNLGVATTCVFKGAPLKGETNTLSSFGIQSGDHIVVVFKKAAPAPAPVPATPAATIPATPAAPVKAASGVSNVVSPVGPVVLDTPAPAAATTTTTTTAAADATTAASPTGTAPPAKTEKKTYDDWACPLCTYINVGARSVCEMCMTPNPARPITRYNNTASETTGAAAGAVSPHAFDTTGMDEATMLAIQQAMAEDMGDGEGEISVDLDELLATAETDENVRKNLARQFELDENASIDDIRAAVSAEAHAIDRNAIDPGMLLSLLSQDPQLRERIGALLPSGNADELTPEMLQTILQTLLQDGGAGMFGEEDDEDVEDMGMDDDMGADPW